MKNKLSVWVVCALVAVVAFAATGCMSTQSQISGENRGSFGEHTRTPVKDFESMGLIFTEAQLTNSVTFGGTSSGEIFTYQALLREAHRVGADAIINVVIDKKTLNATNVRQETWYGSALAIKYTTILSETQVVTTTAPDGSSVTREATNIYFNTGAPAASGGQASGGQGPAAADASPAARLLRGVRQ